MARRITFLTEFIYYFPNDVQLYQISCGPASLVVSSRDPLGVLLALQIPAPKNMIGQNLFQSKDCETPWLQRFELVCRRAVDVNIKYDSVKDLS